MNKQDLRNYITSIILRQEGEFTQEDIYSAIISKFLNENKMDVDVLLLIEIVEDSLDILRRNNNIKSWNGKYSVLFDPIT